MTNDERPTARIGKNNFCRTKSPTSQFHPARLWSQKGAHSGMTRWRTNHIFQRNSPAPSSYGLPFIVQSIGDVNLTHGCRVCLLLTFYCCYCTFDCFLLGIFCRRWFTNSPTESCVKSASLDRILNSTQQGGLTTTPSQFQDGSEDYIQ